MDSWEYWHRLRYCNFTFWSLSWGNDTLISFKLLLCVGTQTPSMGSFSHGAIHKSDGKSCETYNFYRKVYYKLSFEKKLMDADCCFHIFVLIWAFNDVLIYGGTHCRFQCRIWTNLLDQILFLCQNEKGYGPFECHVKSIPNENFDKIHNTIMFCQTIKSLKWSIGP